MHSHSTTTTAKEEKKCEIYWIREYVWLNKGVTFKNANSELDDIVGGGDDDDNSNNDTLIMCIKSWSDKDSFLKLKVFFFNISFSFCASMQIIFFTHNLLVFTFHWGGREAWGGCMFWWRSTFFSFFFFKILFVYLFNIRCRNICGSFKRNKGRLKIVCFINFH